MNFYISRREFYNLLAQAEGWNGMKEFIVEGKPQLDIIDPRLVSLYSELDLNFRIGEWLSLNWVSNIDTIQGAEVINQISNGREIVCINCKPVQGPMGEKQIEIISVSGVAVGNNGWALVNEVYKAAFQIATALEATQRAPLNNHERQILDGRTNSNVAEIRQGIFGHVFQRRLQKFIALLTQSESNAVYLVVTERVFSLLPEQIFQNFIMDSFNFDPSKMNIEEYRKKYNQHLLLDEFQKN